jgi:hypothetical protein
VLQVPSFVVHIADETSSGKTSVQRVAASVWGVPDDEASDAIIGSWYSTRNYVERQLSLQTDLPVILDETSRVDRPEEITKLIYDVAGARGKGRANLEGISRTTTHRALVLSSGEARITTMSQAGGARVRALELVGKPFGSRDDATRKVVQALHAAILGHFGHAGPRFIRWLLEHRSEWPRLRARHQELVADCVRESDSPEAGRLAGSFAAVILAGELAHRVLDLPWSFDAEDQAKARLVLWASIAGDVSDAAGAVRALRDVMSWSYSNYARFRGAHNDPSTMFSSVSGPREGWAGLWDPQVESWPRICFFRVVLEGILEGFGYRPDAVLNAWRERGWLEVEKGRGYERKVRSWMGRTRMVVILRQAIDEVGAI